MEIKFYWNGSFAGTNHSMVINGNKISLGGVVSSSKNAALEAIEILKKDYNIDYDINNIEFKWGGRL